MAFVENLDVFFDTVGGFAQEGTVDGTSIKGVYNEGFRSSLNVETTSPSFTCKMDDLPEGVDEDSVVVVTEGTFKVTEVHNDAGISTLILYQD